MSTSIPEIPGPGTATALLAAVAIYTAGVPPHLPEHWRLRFFLFAFVALAVTLAIEYLTHR